MNHELLVCSKSDTNYTKSQLKPHTPKKLICSKTVGKRRDNHFFQYDLICLYVLEEGQKARRGEGNEERRKAIFAFNPFERDFRRGE